VHGRPLFAGPPEAAGWVVSGASPQTWAHVHLAERRSLGIAARRHPVHRFFASTRQRRAKKKAYKNGDEYKKSVMPVHTTSDRTAQVLLAFVTRAATGQWPKIPGQILSKRILQDVTTQITSASEIAEKKCNVTRVFRIDDSLLAEFWIKRRGRKIARKKRPSKGRRSLNKFKLRMQRNI
jgi:hypothetical protein